MFRSVENDLFEWKTQPNRKPLLIRGARQIGKSYIVEKFGQNHFENILTINFEFEPRFVNCFISLDPEKIIRAIEAMTQQNITPGNTLLFLDEIQECPNAIMALRYFKEKLPALHVIGAGSLLEFALNSTEYRKPVGRVQSLYMKPCSFKEYLMASGDSKLLHYLSEVTLKTGVEEPFHQLLLEKCREYFVLGGMPEVIDYYIKQKKYYGCEKIQASILEYYQKDFPKYDRKINIRILQKIFSKAPSLVAKHFKFVDIDTDVQSRDQKPALEALINSGLLYPVCHTAASGLPLNIATNDKKFKLLFLDVGLVQHASHIDIDTLLSEELILINQGALAEQFVGQELLAYGNNYEKSELYYWEREKKGSQAEVDYIVHFGATVYPIEVKSGATGHLRSLRVFMAEKKSNIGIRISQHQLSLHDHILSIPMYMIFELPRIIYCARP